MDDKTKYAVVELKVGKLALKAGDLLVAQFVDIPNETTFHSLGRHLQSIVPDGAKVLLMMPGIDLTMITKEEIDRRALSAQVPDAVTKN